MNFSSFPETTYLQQIQAVCFLIKYLKLCPSAVIHQAISTSWLSFQTMAEFIKKLISSNKGGRDLKS